jgi:hypothetical protein
MATRARILVGGSLLLVALLAAIWSMERHVDEPAPVPQDVLLASADASELAAAPPIEAADLQPWVRPIGGFAPGTLWIVDGESHEPIASAVITLLTGDVEVDLGITDAKGVWPVAWPDSPPPWRVRVAADGYLTGAVDCDRETRSLKMIAVGTIGGYVTGAPREALAAGLIQVHAWESESHHAAWRSQSAAPVKPRPTRVSVAVDGSFRVRLARGRRHTLIATGPSFGSAQAAENVPADGRSIILEGMSLYGALVRITGPNGASLLGGPDVRQTEPASNTRLLATKPRHVLFGDAYLQWLGLEPCGFDESFGNRQLLVYLPEGDSPDVELTVVRPGYETWSGVVTLPPVTQPLAEIAVVLQPWTLEFGSVEVVIHGMDGIGQRQQADRLSPDAQLHFVATELRGSQANRALALTATIPDLAKIPLVVGPLPAGDYAVSLQGGFALRSPEEEEEGAVVRVRADRVVKVEFDLSMLGVVDVALANSRGAYFGPAQVLLRSNHGRSSWSFGAAPYRIPMLPPGEYEVGLVGEGALPDAEDHLQPISLHAGRITRIFLPVNR